MVSPKKDNELYSYADYITWRDDVRYELIDGQIHRTELAPSVAHQMLVGEVYRCLANQLDRSRYRALIGPVDVRLPKREEPDEQIDTVVRPDVLVLSNPGQLGPRGVRGAPDWVMEVISPSTAGHDQVTKRRIYERAGVREFWLVHPSDRILTAYTLNAEGRYDRPHVQLLQGSTDLVGLMGVRIDWDTVAA
ncbi:MAG: Uma2 family endonuclease [Leptothrix sp. (in: b-proteobacteria)]